MNGNTTKKNVVFLVDYIIIEVISIVNDEFTRKI